MSDPAGSVWSVHVDTRSGEDVTGLVDSGEDSTHTARDILPSLVVFLSGKSLPSVSNDVLFHDTSSNSELVVEVSLPGLAIGTKDNLLSSTEVSVSVDSFAFGILRVD
jgi:hypothetical protein